jgi:hypothetical protein
VGVKRVFGTIIRKVYASKRRSNGLLLGAEEKAFEKEAAALEWQDMHMLMLDPNAVTDPVRAEIIRKRQARITQKYQSLDCEDDA